MSAFTYVPLRQPMVDLQAAIVTRPWALFFTQLAQGSDPSTVSVQPAAKGNGVDDDLPAFQQAYNAVVSIGGGVIFVPAGNYLLKGALNIQSNVPVTFQGEGRASLLLRGAQIATGLGWIDLAAGSSRLKFRDLAFEGKTTTTAKLLYGAINGDPLDVALTPNSTFWIHDGCSDISFENVVIMHTGGYAVLCTAVTNDITDLFFYRLQLENNRPFAFGITVAKYGSWPGGVLLHGNGVSSTAMVRRAHFLSCSAVRCTGNCFWSHVYGFSSLHSECSFVGCWGEDIGLDFILKGGMSNSPTIGCHVRRNGYMTVDDTSQSTPAWSQLWSVAFDHAGLAINCNMMGCSVVSPNGAAYDCDGLADSTIVGCSARVPRSTDFEYAPDQIALIGWGGSTTAGGPNFVYAFQTSNTSQNAGGENCTFVGCEAINMSGGAFNIYAGRGALVEAFNIIHPANATFAPIRIGNINTSALGRSYNVKVCGGTIQYDPGSSLPAIKEDPSLAAFQSGDTNYVLGVTLIAPSGHATLFAKDGTTSSVASITGTAGPSYAGTLTFTSGYVTGKT